jgi:beta-glucuronidase
MDFLKAIYEYVSGIRPTMRPEGDRVALALADRPIASWAGSWTFCVDPFDIGLRKGWFKGPSFDPDGRPLPDDYSAAGWQSHGLPANWNVEDASLLHYEGAVWYSRDVEVPQPDRQGHRFLVFEGVNYRADVWLNGHYLGSHLGGQTPFAFDATPFLRETNQVLLRVDDRRAPERVPGLNFDWFNYGGVYRDFGLVEVPAQFVRDFHLRLDPEDAGFLLADVWTGGRPTAVELEIPEAARRWSLQVDETGHAHGRFAVDLKRWHPGSPHLYRCVLRCGSDEVSELVGFRTIAVKGTDLLLNDAPLQVRGICLHEEVYGRGRGVRDEDVREAFEHARQLGCNLVRLAHYPHDRRVARIADETGMLLWEEIPVYWDLDFANPDTLADASAQLEELVLRDRNRASVVLWAVANETPVNEARNRFLAHLVGRARALDGARPITAACVIQHDGRSLQIGDPLIDLVDVVGLNEYFGWYERGYERLVQLLDGAPTTKPMLVSEVGAGAEAGFHGSAETLFTEECQAEVLRRQFDVLGRYPFVIGTCIWILYDFASPGRQNPHQRGFNRKGLIAEDRRRRKLGFGVLQELYRGTAPAARRAPGPPGTDDG